MEINFDNVHQADNVVPNSDEDDASKDADLGLFLNPPDAWPVYDAYQPLDKSEREVRLLHLQYQPGTTRIEARLENASLDSPFEYEALTYYWGPPDKLKSMFLEDGKVNIGATLYEFLDVLCDKAAQLACLARFDMH